MRPYITEEDAAMRWCPLVRHADETGGVFNRGYSPGDYTNRQGGQGCGCNCIGSDCMMWGWEEWPGGTSNKGRCEAPGGAA